ncbi:MAG: PD40 domain-containing protein [Anaerolineae bacterium]|nr:PD40 domain-containing protein [Anaerolineae bacterium]
MMNSAVVASPVRSTGLRMGLLFLITAFALTALALILALLGPAYDLSRGGTAGDLRAAAIPVPAQLSADDQLLVWLGVGAAPGQHSATEPGRIAYLDGAGVSTPLLEVPSQTSRVQPCGDAPVSPNGQYAAFFLGLDAGTLYLVKDVQKPAAVTEVRPLTCLGGGTFSFSPDSSRMVFINFEAGAEQSEFPDGLLQVHNTADMSEVFRYENVTAFDVRDEGIDFVSFFTNDRNEADEAAVLWWSGSSTVEVATLNPAADDCKFTSASVKALPDGKLLMVLGHRCTSGETRTAWQLYAVDPSARSATLAATDYQAGTFASFARTNRIFSSPDGNLAFFTVPDGVTANTVGLKLVKVDDLAISDWFERQVVMPSFSGSPNAFPRVSPDGRWLAAVVTSPNNENTLYIWSLADASVAPITLRAGSAGDTISSLVFSADSSRLVLVAGGSDAADNSLIAVDLATGTDFRVARGRFGGGLTLSPDGGYAAVLDWQKVDDPKEPPYANLVVIAIQNSVATTLYTGADVVDGKVTNQTFAFPLLWRKPLPPAEG